MLTGHVDEVDDDDAAHVAQTQLAGDLFGCQLVDLEGVLLLVGGLGPDAAVDVDDAQRLGGLDDEIRTLLHRYHLAEGALDLAGHFEMVEDRLPAFVELDDLLLFGRDQGDVLARLLEHLRVVDVDVGERVVEQIAQHGGGLGVLGEEEFHPLGCGHFLPGALPFLDQQAQLGHQDGGRLAFRGGPDDGAVVLGEDAPDKGLKPLFLLLGGDFLGNAHLLGEGEQYNVASCQ